MADKARILFVDDEKRVLNSMRGLFRREYELFLTTEGAEAIRIARDNSIDVIVADQRMPGMTGIEVLGKIKELSPRTIRILLTGYADPEAVEGSINIGEVFRFLSKPCPPKLLRETLGIAISASRTRPATPHPQAPQDSVPAGSGSAARVASSASGRHAVPEKPRQPAVAANAAANAVATSAPRAAAASSANAVDGKPPSSAASLNGTRPAADSAEAAREEKQAQHRQAVQAEDRASQAAGMRARQAKADAQSAAETHDAATEAPESRSSDAADKRNAATAGSAGAATRQAQPDRPYQAIPSATSIDIADNEDTEPALPVLDLSSYEPQLEQTSSHWHTVTNVILSEDTIEETQENVALRPASLSVRDVGVVVFTVDSAFAELAVRALSADRNTILATTLVKVAHAIEEQSAGVLVTDFTTNSAVLQKMIGALKQYMPELVTIVVSSGRDTTDMINLINYGQVFRYVLKPIDPRHLCNDVNAAAIRYLYLQSNPDAVKRHQVIEAPTPPDTSSSLNRFFKKIRVLHDQRVDPTDTVS